MTKRSRADCGRSCGSNVAAGEIYGFLGPNGSGKTTFFAHALRIASRADDGSGRVLGHDVLAESKGSSGKSVT